MKESEENHVPGAFMKSGYDTNFNPNAVSFIPSPSISNDQICSKNNKENHVLGASQNSGYDQNLNPNARPNVRYVYNNVMMIISELDQSNKAISFSL